MRSLSKNLSGSAISDQLFPYSINPNRSIALTSLISPLFLSNIHKQTAFFLDCVDEIQVWSCKHGLDLLDLGPWTPALRESRR